MAQIHASIACNFDANTLLAAMPLFEASAVQAIEWSFDALFKVKEIPPWFTALLGAYATEDRLIGHGVFFSLFSGNWTTEQHNWLQNLRKVSQTYQFNHITEHFGFMTGADFHKGAPLSIPFNSTTLRIGRDRLARIYDACQCPVGLENLAFSYTLDDVKLQGEFLDQLLTPINGFIILDLHNLYCQLHNFDLSFEELIAYYPLQRVREIHISGGSWQSSDIVAGKQIRRDTHDDAVPEKVFELLEKAVQICPNLKFVVLEQLGIALHTEHDKQQFRADFLKMNRIVQAHNQTSTHHPNNNFLPVNPQVFSEPMQDTALYAQQQQLSDILENAPDYHTAIATLGQSSLANSDWKVETWVPEMLETAMKIAQKWKHGFK